MVLVFFDVLLVLLVVCVEQEAHVKLKYDRPPPVRIAIACHFTILYPETTPIQSFLIMSHNDIDINKHTEKATTLLISAPILKVRASGDACQVEICSRAIEFDRSARSPTSSTQQSNSNDVGDGNGNEVVGN